MRSNKTCFVCPSKTEVTTARRSMDEEEKGRACDPFPAGDKQTRVQRNVGRRRRGWVENSVHRKNNGMLFCSRRALSSFLRKASGESKRIGRRRKAWGRNWQGEKQPGQLGAGGRRNGKWEVGKHH